MASGKQAVVADRHKTPATTVRLPETERRWLLAYAEATGRQVNAIIAEAVAEYRERTGDPPQASGS